MVDPKDPFWVPLGGEEFGDEDDETIDSDYFKEHPEEDYWDYDDFGDA